MTSLPGLAPPKPIPIKDRASFLFVEKGQLDMLDGAFVLVDTNGVRTHIPVGGLACLMLEPGTRVSHAAAALAGRVGCLLVWVGEAGVRLYASGQPGGADGNRFRFRDLRDQSTYPGRRGRAEAGSVPVGGPTRRRALSRAVRTKSERSLGSLTL